MPTRSRAAEERILRAAMNLSEELAHEIVAEIEVRAPKLTGKLSTDFHVQVDSDRVRIVTRNGYWRYVEFGTYTHGSAQPFLFNSVDAVARRRGL